MLSKEKWKIDSLDWLSVEYNDIFRHGIFRAFNVPFADLVKNDKKDFTLLD
jgi:hypothetical protein